MHGTLKMDGNKTDTAVRLNYCHIAQHYNEGDTL